jgi:hypothetical protein
MSPTVTIVLIVVILVIIAALIYGVRAGRRKKLQSTFGPEYDRVVADTGSRTEAEKELRERERRHASLELKPLSEKSQATYAAAWEEVQIQFVDDPVTAVATADELVTRLIAERGYPTGDYDDQLANLSVEHANTLQHYRDAHEISERSAGGSASTEDLRQALVHYRALFADLLGTDPVPTSPASPVLPRESSSESAGSGPVADEVAGRREAGDATPAPRKPAGDTTDTPDTSR